MSADVAAIVVTYQVRAAEADLNQRLVQGVFDELARTTPGGLRYAAFRLAEVGRFLHVALIEDPSANPLTDSAAFAVFQKDLAARCEVQPEPSQAQLIGSYRMF